MFSKLVELSVRKSFKVSTKGVSTTLLSRISKNSRRSLLILGSFASLTFHDYAMRDGHYIGATVRFLRSFEIVVRVSTDYITGLHRLIENTEEYENVSDTLQSNRIKSQIFLSIFFSAVAHKRDSSKVSEPDFARLLAEWRPIHQNWPGSCYNKSYSSS